MKQKLPSLPTISRAFHFRRLALLGLFAIGSAMPAAAAIVVTLPTSSTAGSIVITADINYTITTTGGVRIIVMDEWVTSDGKETVLDFTSLPAIGVTYSINSGSPSSMNLSQFGDNNAGLIGAVTDNDGYLFLDANIPVVANDVFTLKAATYAIPASTLPAFFNPQANQTFTGNTFLVDRSVNRVTADTPAGAVPEPSQMVLLTGALLPLALRRRRK